MKIQPYLYALVLSFLATTKLSSTSYLELKKIIEPNLTKTEFIEFKKDVTKLTRPYSSGKCAKFTTALLNNIHERHAQTFPQLSLRTGLVYTRSGNQTVPVTTSSSGIVYAKRYKSLFEDKNNYIKLSFNDIKNLPENTIIIAVYQPRASSKAGHIEVIFKDKNRLIAASDKIGAPSYTLKRLYSNADYYYPVRHDS